MGNGTLAKIYCGVIKQLTKKGYFKEELFGYEVKLKKCLKNNLLVSGLGISDSGCRRGKIRYF